MYINDFGGNRTALALPEQVSGELYIVTRSPFRTPWALEDDENWRITHRQGSAAWFAGGTAMVLINLWALPGLAFLVNYFLLLTLIAVPFIISYRTYRRLSGT